MEADSEKLIAAIKIRTDLYDQSSNKHSNKLVTEKLWEEIAVETGCSVSDCKKKWASLRNCFTRHMRQTRILPKVQQRLLKKRKRWYLADKMSFLEKHCKIVQTENYTDDSVDSFQQISSPVRSDLEAKDVYKMSPKSITNSVPEPEFEYSNTNNMESDADAMFFQSILIDFKHLSRKSKRSFKEHMLTKLNELQDKDEISYGN